MSGRDPISKQPYDRVVWARTHCLKCNKKMVLQWYQLSKDSAERK